MARLSDPVTLLRGVGQAKAAQLAQLNIATLGDLICHFPRGYEDRTKIVPIDRLEVDHHACFRARVVSTPRTAHIRKGLDVTKVQVADSTAKLTLTFFNQRFTTDRLEYGREYIFYGALTGDFGGYGMTSPVFESPDEPGVCTRAVVPVYPLTAGVSNAYLTKLIRRALDVCDTPPEVLPPVIRARYAIMPARQAYRVIHAPQSVEQAQAAKKRMAFEEFFVFSAGLALLRASREQKRAAAMEDADLTLFLAALPFSLTNAQRRAVDEIARDMRAGVPMNRLVQGDVGSGKTMVAAAAVYLAAKNGWQSALMAPTEILAEQHFASLSKLFAPLGVRVVLLTGSMGVKEKRLAREALASGEAKLAVGTHALVSDATAFAKLGLVVTDEQHRFGVAQRAALSAKGDGAHLLVMSATPIPRTLALLLYGDLEVSVLDELPPGRQKVDTFLVGEGMRARVNAFIRKQAQQGHQCFVVCPAVEENEALSLKSATLWAQTLQKTVFPDLRVALLHGQMKGAEKEAVMRAFAQGEADILVATTVVEVGVDVPNATLMVIEDADRFGLSQLHQLRGRVGRGSAKSYCILTTHTRSEDAIARLKALCATNDGFRIAQEDLRLRGPGDFFGARQSGLPMLRLADPTCDMALLQQAQSAAKQWIETEGTSDTSESIALRARVGETLRRAEGTLN